MNDKELLELAAKAAGMRHLITAEAHGEEYAGQWNPLTDDGDALRLAVVIGHDITVMKNKTCHSDAELCAATRRAIVRVAAEIGKGMP